jgi:hypothetical protein
MNSVINMLLDQWTRRKGSSESAGALAAKFGRIS